MACEEFENEISDYLENQLLPADRSRVAAHLAGCAGCRAFARRLEQLDAELLRAVPVPALSATFKTGLQQRLQNETVAWTAVQCAERKRRLLAEYEAGLARLNRFSLPPPRKLLEGLGYAGLIALVGGLTWLFLPRLENLLAGPAAGGGGQSLLLSLLASAIFVAIGLAAAFPRQVRKLWLAV